MEKLLLLTVFLIPLLGTYKGLGYEQIKVLFYILSISLIGLLWKGKGFKWTLISKAAGLFIVILWLTSLTGINPQDSILGTDPYFQGAILYSYLFLFYLIVKSVNIKLENWAKVLVGSAIVVALLAIKDWVLLNIFNQQIPTYAGRVVSTFGQPNFYAGFLLLTLPFSYFLFKNLDKKLSFLGFTAGLVSMVGIFVSHSRLTILLTLFLLILGLIDQLKIKFKMGFIVLGIIFISMVLALRFSSGIVGNEISAPFLTNNPDLTQQSVEKRVYIWPVAWQVFLQKPLIGYGLENINLAFSNYFQINKHPLFEENLKISPVLISLKELNIDRTHNYILDLLLSSGILGLLAWLFLILMLLKRFYIRKMSLENTTLLVGFIAYSIWVQFQNQSVVHLVYFWLLAGLIDQDRY